MDSQKNARWTFVSRNALIGRIAAMELTLAPSRAQRAAASARSCPHGSNSCAALACRT